MLPIISGREGDLIKIEVTINLSGSMLEAEESILQGVNAVGTVATGEALKRFDADGDPIMVGEMVFERQGAEDLSYALWRCFNGASCLSACRRRQDLLPDGCWGEGHQKGNASVCQDRVAQICARRRHTGFGRLGAEPWPPLPEGHFAGFGHACRDGGPDQRRKLELRNPGAG